MTTHPTTKKAIQAAADRINDELIETPDECTHERIAEIITEEFARCQCKDLHLKKKG